MSVNNEEETSAVLDRVRNQVIDRTKTELYGGIQCDCQEEKDALMGQRSLTSYGPSRTHKGGEPLESGSRCFPCAGFPHLPTKVISVLLKYSGALGSYSP